MGNETTVVINDRRKKWDGWRRALDEAGKGFFVDVGLFEDTASEDVVKNHAMANEFGVPDASPPVPARPFFRPSFDDAEQGMINQIIRELDRGPHMHLRDRIEELGKDLLEDLEDRVSSYPGPGPTENRPATIRKKGFDRPLFETGEMLDALDLRFKTANPATKGEL